VSRLKDKIVVITGGASGIGLATSLLFEEEGARLAVVDASQANLDQLATQWHAADTWMAFNAKVQDVAAADRIVSEVVAKWGRIDALVTAAAVSGPGKLPDTSPDDWDHCFEVNAKGIYIWMRAAIPQMARQKAGSIITYASQLALAGGEGHAIYVATKGAVIAMTQTVALDHAEDGIRANILVPGAIDTPGMRSSFARRNDGGEKERRSQARHALRRFGRPEEVARAALYLASDDSTFTTGSSMYVDGGWHVA
jgi:2-keto-3-deoxy-L-fuconate dehydrogenase